MKTNMSLIDRTVRLLVAVVLSILYYTGVLTGTWAFIGVIVALVLLATAIVGICPLYLLFGLHTNTTADKTVHKQH